MWLMAVAVLLVLAVILSCSVSWLVVDYQLQVRAGVTKLVAFVALGAVLTALISMLMLVLLWPAY